MKTWGRLAFFLFFAAARAFAGGAACGDETPCTDDGLFCNGAEICQSGICVHAGDPCGFGPCIEESDTCEAECGNGIVAGGEECDDGVTNGTTECGCTEECTWRAEGTGCGDPTSTECDLGDVCDGFGSCGANFAEEGTFCGDTLGDQCTNPDTCDSSGVCLSNHLEDGTQCTDLTFCNGVESCLDGLCISPGSDPCGPDQTCREESDVCESPLLLDIDANGEIDPLKDGLLLLRHLFGFTGNVLIDGAVDTFKCNRCTADAIDSYLDDLRSASSALL